MKKQIVFLIAALLAITSLQAQVKIGDNPQSIHPASVLELQSNNRVLVITRVTDAQMSTINPLRGAMVYNTDAECIHYFNGTEWINICEELDNSFTVSTEAVFNTLPDSRDSTVVVTQTETPDGINYNFEVNRITGDNIYNRTIFGVDLAFGSISEAELQNGAVGLTKLADGASAGQLMQWDGTDWVLISEADITITEVDGVIGNEVTNATTGGSLQRNGGGTDVDPWTLDVVDGGINTDELADNAVTTVKILDGTIATLDLDDDIITNAKMATDAVGTLELINDSVDRDKINADIAGTGLIQAGDGSLEVDVAQLSGDGDITSPDGTITLGGTTANALFEDVSFDVADNAITNAKMADNAINTAEIVNNAVTTVKVADNAITTAKILDANITNAKIADNAVNIDKIGTLGAADANSVLTTNGAGDPLWEDRANFASSTLNDGNIFVGDATNNANGVAMSGDATITNAGVLTVSNDAITTVKILDANVTNAKIADNAVNIDKIGTLGAADANSVLTTDGAGDPLWEDRANFASSTLNDGNIFVGDATNNANGVAMSGDATITNAGVLTVSNDAITTVKILDANVTNAKIADNAVNIDKIGTLGAADANSVLTTNGAGDPLWEDRANFASSTLNNGNIFVGDATNNANGVAMSGDATITNTGALTIADNAVNVAKIGTLGAADANRVLTTDGSGDPQWEPRANLGGPDVAGKLSALGTTPLNNLNITSVDHTDGTGIYTVNFVDLGTADYTITTSVEGLGDDTIINIIAVNSDSFTVEIKEIEVTTIGYADGDGFIINIPTTQKNPIDKNWSFTIFNF